MNKISRTGIVACLIRAGNFIEGPGARARSGHTRMRGLLGICERSMNLLAIRAAEENIVNRILTESGHSEESSIMLMRKLSDKMLFNLADEISARKKIGGELLESAEASVVREFARRMDSGAFEINDNRARETFKKIFSQFPDARAFAFIRNRLQGERPELILSLICDYPKMRERILPDLLTMMEYGGLDKKVLLRKIKVLGGLVGASSYNEETLTKIYMSLRNYLNDTGLKELVYAKPTSGGKVRNTYRYPIISAAKVAIETVHAKLRESERPDQTLLDRIAADITSAPEHEFVEIQER